MTLSRDKLSKRLDLQATFEGEADNVADCRVVLAHCQTANNWQALTTVRHHRYGVLSYETHHFYSVKPWVLEMIENWGKR